jgi:uncharacterized protein involved in exopolysaccharide biosynthesis
MTKQEFSPRESLENAISSWRIVLIITILGGIAGWTFHFFRPPIYQAMAILTVNMDFPKLELTQLQQDYAFGAAGALISSNWEKGDVISEAKAEGILIPPNFQEQMTLEAKQSVWELQVRDQDPQVATRLANIWADTAYGALNYTLQHAFLADQIQGEIISLENCMKTPTQVLTTTSNSSALFCGYSSLTAAQDTLKNKINELANEKKISSGILSIMTFSVTSYATTPNNPIVYSQAGLILAGVFIGFIISLWVTNIIKF